MLGSVKTVVSAWLAWVLVCASAVYFAADKRKEFQWQLMAENLQSFDDSEDHGQSSILTADVVNDQLVLVARLDSGFAFPYVGVTLRSSPQEISGPADCPNVSGYDSLVITYRQNHPTELHLQAATWDPLVTRSGVDVSQRILDLSLPPSLAWSSIGIALTDFQVATWWKTMHGVPTLSRETFLENTCRIGFVLTGFPRSQTDSLLVRGLVFSGPDRTWFWIAFAFGLVAGAILLFATLAFARRRKESRRQASLSEAVRTATEHSPATELPPTDWDRLLKSMGENFQDPELNIERINQLTGLNAAKIAALVRDNTGENFKGLLNRLRMQRAKELLQRPDLQVSQVAELCGYSNPTHFTRVFRQETGKAPRDWRAQAN